MSDKLCSSTLFGTFGCSETKPQETSLTDATITVTVDNEPQKVFVIDSSSSSNMMRLVQLGNTPVLDSEIGITIDDTPEIPEIQRPYVEIKKTHSSDHIRKPVRSKSGKY